MMNGGKSEMAPANQGRNPKIKANFGGICYKSDDQDREHLQKCLTGCLKEGVHWRDIGNLIKELCGGLIKASHLGGGLVLF